MKLSLANAGDLEVLQGTRKGEEVSGVVPVGLGRMLRKVQGPLLPHEPLQKLLNHGLDLLSHFS